MNLHKNPELFEQLILLTAEYKSIDPSIIEKDYYVTLFLMKLHEKEPDIIFKGGTSLSKCHKVIKRFSEDIDLNLDNGHLKLTEARRKKLKRSVRDTIDELQMILTNPDEIRSRRDYNKYIIEYDSNYDFQALKQHLIVETAVSISSFPFSNMETGCYIYEYLMIQNRNNIVNQYNLETFLVKVQDINRTFIDKVFAIGDYYLDGRIWGHSRHIYDLHKLYPFVIFDDAFKRLVSDVRMTRKVQKVCLSAMDENDMQSLLCEIINQDVYQDDYNGITKSLLFENIDYMEAIKTLKKIEEDRLFEMV